MSSISGSIGSLGASRKTGSVGESLCSYRVQLVQLFHCGWGNFKIVLVGCFLENLMYLYFTWVCPFHLKPLYTFIQTVQREILHNIYSTLIKKIKYMPITYYLIAVIFQERFFFNYVSAKFGLDVLQTLSFTYEEHSGGFSESDVLTTKGKSESECSGEGGAACRRRRMTFLDIQYISLWLDNGFVYLDWSFSAPWVHYFLDVT